MFQIRIIGLGPGTEKFLTNEAIQYIEDEYPNFLRTQHHASTSYFKDRGIAFQSFDKLYEEMDSFSSVYESIAQGLIKEAQASPINYFVPGDPLIAEEAVQILLSNYDQVKLVHGVSFIEPVLGIVNSDPVNGLKIINGDGFSHLDFDPQVDTIITQVYNQRILSDLKIAIGDIYGDECKLWLISNAGMEDLEEAVYLSAYELDRGHTIGVQTSIFIPGGQGNLRHTMKDLMRRLESKPHLPSREALIQDFLAKAKKFEEHSKLDDPYVREMDLGDLLNLVLALSYRDIEDGHYTVTDLTSGAMERLPDDTMEDGSEI